MRTLLAALDAQMSQSDFWMKKEEAQAVSKEASQLREEIANWDALMGEVVELSELSLLDDDALQGEIKERLTDLNGRFSKMEFAMLLSGAYDKETAIMAVHVGSGGTEAQDWTQILTRMYSRFAERKGWHVTILSESRAEDVGLKSITMRIEGRYAYGYLKSEAGVHRLVRISPFDAEKMRHTTFALVEVIPELEEIPEIDLDPKDLRIDTFMSSGKGGQSVNTTYSAIRIVHVPTNIVVSCQNERSQQQNKETAMKILKSKLHQMKEQEQEKKKAELRGEHQSAEWGNQIRSYVLHPYKMVKDHRTNYETSDAEGVLDGDLEPFMEAYLKWNLWLKNTKSPS